MRATAGKTRRNTLAKLTQIAVTRQTYRFQGVNRMNGQAQPVIAADGTTVGFTPPGYFKLQMGANVVGDQPFPLHIMALTPIQNNATSIILHQQLRLSDAGGPVFSPLPGQNSANSATASNWQADNTTGIPAGVVNLNTRFFLTDHYDIRMVCYGARSQPTFYNIMIVRFTQECLHPNTAVIAASENEQKQKSFWQGTVKNLCYNRILPGAPGWAKGMTVLKTLSFTLQSSSGDEIDRTPAARIVKLFVRDGKLRDHNWGPHALATDLDVNDADWAPNPGSGTAGNVNDPNFKDRLYMIVRASNTTPVLPAAETADNTPSYDLIVRKQFRHREF